MVWAMPLLTLSPTLYKNVIEVTRIADVIGNTIMTDVCVCVSN